MAKVAVIAAAGIVAGALFLALRPAADEDARAPGGTTEATGDATTAEEATTAETTTAETTTAAAPTQGTRINIVVRNGRPVGGVVRVDVERGRRVDLVVRSDVADHVHVHGHDFFADVGPGQPARFRFRATIPGRIEVELEDAHTLLAELAVRP